MISRGIWDIYVILQTLQANTYCESQLTRILFKNVEKTQGIAHLVQTCRDNLWSFTQSVAYLRCYNRHIDPEPVQKRTMLATNPSFTDTELDEVRTLFHSMVQDSNIFMTYKTFENKSFRQRLSVPDTLWNALKPEIKKEILSTKKRLLEEQNSRSEPPKVPRTSSPAPSESKLPSQYPNMSKSKVNISETLENFHIGDDDVEDDDELAFYKIDQIVNSMNTITVRANYFKANKYGKHYALSDSGADSTVVGSMAHVVGYTGRSATLVGYKPDSTATPLVP